MSAPTPPSPPEPIEPKHGSGPSSRTLFAVVVLVVIVAGAILLLAGKGSSSSPPAASRSAGKALFSGSEASPPEREPALALRNYNGEAVNMSNYRGKAVLVTFIYTHCPDVCPLITANLHVAQGLLGPVRDAKLQIIAVSVDPRGDTPKTVASFLSKHDMTGHMKYLIGSASQLARVWKAWGVGSERDVHNPGIVEHTGLVYGISASGKVMTLYAGNFRPAEIVHDVPLLETR